jgi:hypothetical protein
MLLTKPGRCHLGEEASEPCLKVAHRVVSWRRSNSVAFGAERT